MDVQPPEQFLLPREQGLERVHQQTLAKPPWPGEEVMTARGHQLPDERRLVDVIEIFAPDRREVLDPDGQRLPRHDLLSERQSTQTLVLGRGLHVISVQIVVWASIHEWRRLVLVRCH